MFLQNGFPLTCMHVFSKSMFLYFKSACCSTGYSPVSKSIEQVYDPLESICFDFTFWRGKLKEIKTNGMTLLLSILQYDEYFEAYVMEQMQKSSLNKLCWHPV